MPNKPLTTLSFFSLVFWRRNKANAKNTKDFLLLSNPRKPWKSRGKPLEKPRKLQRAKKKQGNKKKPRGATLNRYTKRPLQDSATIFSTFGMGESAFLLRKSQCFLQMSATPRAENPRIFPLENAICCIS